MPSFTELAAENSSFAANAVNYQSLNNANATTGVLDMSKFHRVEFILFVGAGTGTVNVGIQQGNNSNGTGAANIANTFITNIANTPNSIATTEIGANQLTGRYVNAIVTENATLATNVLVLVRAFEPRFRPNPSTDVAAVKQRLYTLP